MAVLLSREKFRDAVFHRDRYNCVVCGALATAAHHLIERRLWSDGGYYISNGASLCDDCHILAEQTVISVEEIREAAGIKEVLLPPHMYDDVIYDKWGNTILPDGTRTRGELFYDESVQKILSAGGKLDLFSKYVKYPRTYHLPNSPGVTDDDRIIESLSGFENERVIISLKCDGECTTVNSDGYVHARAIDYSPHPSRDWMKSFAPNFAYDLPVDWRVCGENLYARHSIEYRNLPSYFMVFSIWNGYNECLSWQETVEWCKLLGIEPVPILYEGLWNKELITDFYDRIVQPYSDEVEGYVVRVARSFHFSEFRNVVAKYVRKNHVKPENHHWMFQKVVVNKLGENDD